METESDLVKGLLNKKYQMVFLSFVPDLKEIFAVPCGKESLYLAVIPAHPAAVYKDTGISFHDVNGETFLMAADVGIWEKVHQTMLPDSRFIRQKDLDLLTEVVNSSSLAAFASSMSLQARRPNYRAGRIMIPFTDPEATIQFYCVCLEESREKFMDWFHYVKKNIQE